MDTNEHIHLEGIGRIKRIMVWRGGGGKKLIVTCLREKHHRRIHHN